jgi:hypothetical protein
MSAPAATLAEQRLSPADNSTKNQTELPRQRNAKSRTRRSTDIQIIDLLAIPA